MKICPLIREDKAHYSYLVSDFEYLEAILSDLLPKNVRLARIFKSMLDNQDKIVKELVSIEEFNKVITAIFYNSDKIDKVLEDNKYRRR